MRMKKHIVGLAAALIALACMNAPAVAVAETAEELQAKIKERNDQIQKLETEIKEYQGQIQETGKQATSLKSAISTLTLNGRKLETELNLTQSSISKAELTLQGLALDIKQKEIQIRIDNAAIGEALRSMQQADDNTTLETLLTKPDLATAWTDMDTLGQVQSEISDRVKILEAHRKELEGKLGLTEAERNKLMGLKTNLSDQRQLVEQNKKEKSSLLTQTKNKEAEFKAIVAQKTAQREAFEKEMFNYESQLKLILDKSKIVVAGKGVLSWPVDNPVITQYFGRTVDAQRLYTSGTHNGIDLRAPLNTPIKASLSGTVTATGNTDAQAGCYSYGKWILIEHANGLSTLYSHLNLIKVSAGQTVATGEVIGYSGQTGYATGPHLHFTVYATQAVSVQQYVTSNNCKNVTIPISNPKGYFDPMLYL